MRIVNGRANAIADGGSPVPLRIARTVASKTIEVCRLVPLLPVVVAAAVPLALLWDWRPWGPTAPWGALVVWGVTPNPSVGQWIVIALVSYTVIVTLLGMIDDVRHGQVGIDLLAVLAMLSTIAVGEYWAGWAVTLMIASGEAIEGYAEAKAEHSLTALVDAAPRVAHVLTLPGVGSRAGSAAGAAGDSGVAGAAGDAATSAAASVTASAVAPSEPPSAEFDGGFRPVRAQTTPEASASASGVSPSSVPVAQGNAAQGAGVFRTVSVGQVSRGDALVVLPGETVPVDGELLSGSATLDLSAINGEPMPREVFAGARVMSGAVNGATALTMRATREAADSQYQRILELVSSAQESRPAVVRTADRLSVPFTIVSLLIAGVAWALAGDPVRFAQVLVLATPCPLLIAAPVAYVAGTGRLARAGVLIKTQDVLERLGRVTHVFFDKTGTLTVKQPQVVRVEMLPGVRTELDADHVLMLAGVVEGYSVHILSQGIAKAGREAVTRLRRRFTAGERLCPEPQAAGLLGHGRDDYPVVRHVREDAGKGVSGEVDGHVVRVGRLAFANASPDGFQPTAAVGGNDVGGATDGAVGGAAGAGAAGAGAVSVASSASSAARSDEAVRTRFGALRPDEMASYVAVDGMLVARIVLRDVPRANAADALSRLRRLGVGRLTMLTGDKRASAAAIAGEVGIGDVRAELFPEDKVKAVRGAAQAGEVTMMVGDGVNDAPVLASADLGVAMTDGTSTAASESAQIVIMNDDIGAVPQAIAIARRTRRVMLEAVLAGLALAVIGMVAAAFDLIPVVVGAFLQEAIDVVSILWALTALLDRD